MIEEKSDWSKLRECGLGVVREDWICGVGGNEYTPSGRSVTGSREGTVFSNQPGSGGEICNPRALSHV